MRDRLQAVLRSPIAVSTEGSVRANRAESHSPPHKQDRPAGMRGDKSSEGVNATIRGRTAEKGRR